MQRLASARDFTGWSLPRTDVLLRHATRSEQGSSQSSQIAVNSPTIRVQIGETDLGLAPKQWVWDWVKTDEDFDAGYALTEYYWDGSKFRRW